MEVWDKKLKYFVSFSKTLKVQHFSLKTHLVEVGEIFKARSENSLQMPAEKGDLEKKNEKLQLQQNDELDLC